MPLVKERPTLSRILDAYGTVLLAPMGAMAGYLSLMPAFQKLLGDHYFEVLGVWLGVVLVVYCAALEGTLRLRSALLILFASCGAHQIASYVAFFGAIYGPSSHNLEAVPACALFLGGFVGALILSLVFLYFNLRNKHGFVSKLLVCSLTGGVLGVVGAYLGSALGDHAKKDVIARMSPILYILWQAGMAVTLGLALKSDTHQR